MRRISLCNYALQLPLAVVFFPKSQELKIIKKNENYINTILSSEHMQSIMGFKKIYDIGTCFRECTSLHYLFSWVDTCVYIPRAP